MKRIFVTIGVLLGIGGLIGLMSYHPETSASTDGSSATPSPEALSQAGAATPTPTSTPTPVPTSAKVTPAGRYKDGTYTGTTEQTGYGALQVQAVISGGRLTGVNFLKMPYDRDQSVRIASSAKPVLLREAIAAQSAQVDVVTGATDDWEGFVKSLQSALDQA